jgi:hypothetical protein
MSETAKHPERPTHPDFDGHLERQVIDMTLEERLDWAWEMMQRLHWARQARRVTAPEPQTSDRNR